MRFHLASLFGFYTNPRLCFLFFLFLVSFSYALVQCLTAFWILKIVAYDSQQQQQEKNRKKKKKQQKKHIQNTKGRAHMAYLYTTVASTIYK